jgi:hypothetical protein
MKMRDTKAALIWITDILKELNVPFQIAGGLAARVYGAKRELDDIDIDIPEDKFDVVKERVAEFITFGPEHFVSDKWDLMLMTLRYHDQDIDLGGAYQTKIFDIFTQQWRLLETDLTKTEMKEIFGLLFPVIPCKDLIEYKKMLSREVDVIDIREIQCEK